MGNIEPNWQYYLTRYEQSSPRWRAVADAVGISHAFLIQKTLGHRGPVGANTAVDGNQWRSERDRLEALHKRFWSALALHELAREVPPTRVAKMFGVQRGALQALQSLAVGYCGMVRQLCERLRWHETAAIFDSIMPRLNFGISADALPLCKIPGVFPMRARALQEAGFTSVESIARASFAEIEAVLRRLCQFESLKSNGGEAKLQEAVVRQAAQRIVRGAQE